MNARATFLKQKELVKWWVQVKNDDRFSEVMTHATAMFVETDPDRAALKGAQTLISTLEQMTDNLETGGDFPNPGLHHNIDTLPPFEPEKK